MQTTRPGEPAGQLIGVYGGTFDPIHYGHLRPALDVLNQLELDHVRFIPCFTPVHRAHPQVSSEQRCEMIELAIARQPNFILDKREIERQGPSFMVDTLRSLKQDFPQASLVLMMGTDAFAKFLSWHECAAILELAHLAVMHRPNEPLPSQGALAQLLEARLVTKLPSSPIEPNQRAGQIVEVEVTQLDLSATRLRELLKNGQPIDYLMPPSVIDYIKQHQLYL
ncbi:MAG: nicotinate-nucleotide adenylyltransferase [Thiomicrospira sp.]|uniref:nicotinate-nucleotide adenylyltransferase n=1 Tax=Thiomicrospira sp. TaxID=935 RepID=UPI0019F5027F|nr:nicotinate-nucleotide adenylyltransferase [Thiomicrospira sp.]MBE0494193.1 nicotinate-nucleotide adenylyltransferase [Thiomicrospira sp.]